MLSVCDTPWGDMSKIKAQQLTGKLCLEMVSFNHNDVTAALVSELLLR